MKKKVLIPVLAVSLALCCAIGGTIAWLTDKTDPVVNTFTVGDIDITLTESEANYKIVPGHTIAKDPKVTVEAGSEKSYLFVKVDKTANFDTFMTYEMATGWETLDGETGVFYRVVETNKNADQEFVVLADNQVAVRDTVDKEMLDGLTGSGNYPKLTFTAYAVQYFNGGVDEEGQATFFSPDAAWDIATNQVAP